MARSENHDDGTALEQEVQEASTSELKEKYDLLHPPVSEQQMEEASLIESELKRRGVDPSGVAP